VTLNDICLSCLGRGDEGEPCWSCGLTRCDALDIGGRCVYPAAEERTQVLRVDARSAVVARKRYCPGHARRHDEIGGAREQTAAAVRASVEALKLAEWAAENRADLARRRW